jgi:hypothetical protein
MAQQTAVEWLIYELNTRQKPLYNNQIDELFEKAKQIEKENITMAFKDGRWSGPFVNATAEEYYNEIYGK